MHHRTQILVLALATLAAPFAVPPDSLTENTPLSTRTALPADVTHFEGTTNAGAPTCYPLTSYAAAPACVPTVVPGADAAATARPAAAEPAAWHRLLSDVAQHSRG